MPSLVSDLKNRCRNGHTYLGAWWNWWLR